MIKDQLSVTQTLLSVTQHLRDREMDQVPFSVELPFLFSTGVGGSLVPRWKINEKKQPVPTTITDISWNKKDLGWVWILHHRQIYFIFFFSFRNAPVSIVSKMIFENKARNSYYLLIYYLCRQVHMFF